MIAKSCKIYVQKLFQQEEPNRHDEDFPAGVHYSICHSQIFLARPFEHTYTHPHMPWSILCIFESMKSMRERMEMGKTDVLRDSVNKDYLPLP